MKDIHCYYCKAVFDYNDKARYENHVITVHRFELQTREVIGGFSSTKIIKALCYPNKSDVKDMTRLYPRFKLQGYYWEE